METTPTTENGKQDWTPAINASAEAETERKQKGKAPRSFMEKVACSLTEKDIAGIAGEIEKADAEANALEDERKAMNDGFKARISLAEQRRTDLIGKVRSKTEMREVECVEEFIFATNTVRVTRADTKDVIRERAMTRNERQEELPLLDTNGKPSKGEEAVEALKNPGKGTKVSHGCGGDLKPVGETKADPTEIADPQAALDGKAPPEKRDATPKKVKRGAKGRK